MLTVGHAGTGTYRNALYYYCFFSSLKVLQYFDHWMVLHTAGCRSCRRVGGNYIFNTMDIGKCSIFHEVFLNLKSFGEQ